MAASMLLGAFDWIGDFFKALFDMIPKIMYLLYASLACLLDVFQLLFRKLAGLDVYYVDGEKVTGDIVTNFITGILGINSDGLTYPILSTVFWSFIIFGLIMVFMTTIVAIIKAHYSYDDKSAKGPMQYVYTAGKAVINMAAVPIIVVLGLYINQAILTAVDSITSTTSSSVESLYGDKVSLLKDVETVNGDSTYIYYDIFGFTAGILYGDAEGWKWATDDAKKLSFVGASTQTFSGSMFKVAAYNANRARTGYISAEKGGFTGAEGSSLELFANANGDNEKLADMIDTAFACNLHTEDWFKLDYSASLSSIVSLKYFTSWLTTWTKAFSKFNVGLVWYFYDLWQFNFIVAFAGIMICLSLFINIIFGLISRLFTCIVLFLIAPPLFGLAPLDGGKAGTSWRSNFMKQVLMTYGAVGGMNLMFLILPYLNTIDFFNIAIADLLMQTLIIIAGLITIKAIIALISDLVGGADANKTGEGLAQETGKMAKTGMDMTMGAAKIGAKVWSGTTGYALGMAGGALAATKPGQAVIGKVSAMGTKMFSGGASAFSNLAAFAKNPTAFTFAKMTESKNKKAAKDEESRAHSNDIKRNIAKDKARKELLERGDELHGLTGKEKKEKEKEFYDNISKTLTSGGMNKTEVKEWMKEFKKAGGLGGFYSTMEATKGKTDKEKTKISKEFFHGVTKSHNEKIVNRAEGRRVAAEQHEYSRKVTSGDIFSDIFKKKDDKKVAGSGVTEGVDGFSGAATDQIYRAVKKGIEDGMKSANDKAESGAAKSGVVKDFMTKLRAGVKVQIEGGSTTSKGSDGTYHIHTGGGDYKKLLEEIKKNERERKKDQKKKN